VRSHELAPYVLPVPGAGTGIASVFLAYTGDGSKFGKPSEAANYTGLVPRGHGPVRAHNEGGVPSAGAAILQAPRPPLRAKEGGRLRTKFYELNGRTGKTKSAVAAARRLVCLLRILVTRAGVLRGHKP
jgi:hypothetical protein